MNFGVTMIFVFVLSATYICQVAFIWLRTPHTKGLHSINPPQVCLLHTIYRILDHTNITFIPPTSLIFQITIINLHLKHLTDHPHPISFFYQPTAAPHSRKLLRLPSDASIGSTASTTTVGPYDPNFKPNDLLKIPLTSSLGSFPSSASVSGQPSSSGSGSGVGVGSGAAASKRALDLFMTRGRAKNLDYLLTSGPSPEIKVPEKKNKPKLGMRDKEERKKVKVEIIREVKERAKEREDEELGKELEKSPSKAGGMMKEKPYAYAGHSRSMKKLLGKRKLEKAEELAAAKEAGRVAKEAERAALEAERAASAIERENGTAVEGREEEEDDRMDSTEDDNTPQPLHQQLYQPPASFTPTYTPMNTDEHDQDLYMTSASDEPFGSFDPSGVRLSSSGRIGRPKRDRPGKVTIRREAVSTGAGGSGSALTGPVRSGANKFSAKFEEEEEEGAEKDAQEKIQPRYEAPSGFSFAKPVCQRSHLLTSKHILI